MPDLQTQVDILKREVQELRQRLEARNSASDLTPDMPYTLVQLGFSKNVFTVSSKTAASETQAVDEGGAGTYDVAKAPDGFVQTTVANTTYYIPMYTS